jgi:Family of unknown function (DUF6152)
MERMMNNRLVPMMTSRRVFLFAGASLPLMGLAHAHHGWSSFDQERPVYLEGKARKVKWQNPHAEIELALISNFSLPPDLASREVPPQTAPVPGKALLAKAVLPKRKDSVWEVELAPLTRMQSWNVPEIKIGSSLAVLGFTVKDEAGAPVLRVEYLWLDGKTYALRSSPV